MPIFGRPISDGSLCDFGLICEKLCLNIVGLSIKIPIFGFTSPISQHIELKFLLWPNLNLLSTTS